MSEDQVLQDVANEVCKSVDPSVHVDRVVWGSSAPIYPSAVETRPVVPDQPRIIKVPKGGFLLLLSREAQGRLSPDDWRPLIASAVIFLSRMGRAKSGRRVSMLVLVSFFPMLVVLGIVAQYVSAFSNSLAGVSGLAILALWIALLYAAAYHRRNLALRERLASDKEAERLLGPGQLLNVLLKIDLMKFPDVEKLERSRIRKYRLYTQLTVSDRISNLRLNVT